VQTADSAPWDETETGRLLGSTNEFTDEGPLANPVGSLDQLHTEDEVCRFDESPELEALASEASSQERPVVNDLAWVQISRTPLDEETPTNVEPELFSEFEARLTPRDNGVPEFVPEPGQISLTGDLAASGSELEESELSELERETGLPLRPRPGVSPLAIQSAQQWDGIDRPEQWQGKVYGLVVHTTGGGLPASARDAGVYPTVRAASYYTQSHGCHYVNGWGGSGAGDLVQVANEREQAAGVSVSNPKDPRKDQRRSIELGNFAKDLSQDLVARWRARWPGYEHSLKLLPGTRTANSCYVHVECVPCVFYYERKLFTAAAPLRPGLRFTKAQHDTIAILACEIARRNGWPLDERWWRSPRLVGHEDLTPLTRHDRSGGWDPGFLRPQPYFDWDYVYSQIEILCSRSSQSAPALPGRLSKVLKTPSGEVGADEQEVGRSRSFIAPVPATSNPEIRAFNPQRSDKTGSIHLAVRVRNMPAGGSVRWSVPPSHRSRIILASGHTTQTGTRADITAVKPGPAFVDVEVRDAHDRVVESVKFALGSPQFVSVDTDASFDAVLSGYGLVATEIEEVLRVAKSVTDTILSQANVRTVWRQAPFREQLPPHLRPGRPGNANVTKAVLMGTNAEHLYGETTDRNGDKGPGALIGPEYYDENIFVYAGEYSTPVAGHANEHVDEMTNRVVSAIVGLRDASSAEKTLAMEVLGRLYGETLAHEICHALIGRSLADGWHNPSPGFLDDLMNRGRDRSFANRTGFIVDPAHITKSDILTLLSNDKGIYFINIPTRDAREQIDKYFPVPPSFK
jgi:hypothetical protein